MTAELNSKFSRTFTNLIFMCLIFAVKMEDRTSWRSFYYNSPVHLSVCRGEALKPVSVSHDILCSDWSGSCSES